MKSMYPSRTSAWSLFRREDLGESLSRDQKVIELIELNLQTHAVSTHELHLAQELIHLDGHRPTTHDLPMLLLLITVMADIRGGSTRTPIIGHEAREHLRRHFCAFLGTFKSSEDGFHEQIGDWIDDVVARVTSSEQSALIGYEPLARRPFIYWKGHLHEQHILRRELDLARRFIGLMDATIQEHEISASSHVRPFVESEFALTDEQSAAVVGALSARISLVSGGPGTGKTSIIIALIDAFLARGIALDSIILAAPTGKAAWRMTESIRSSLRRRTARPSALAMNEVEAVTVHRLLGYIPRTGGFRHHSRAPLAAQVIIVDEASMLDTTLAERLLASLGDRAHLVMLGDEDQLPSVSAGAVFKAMIAASPDHTARLTHNFRMRKDDPLGSKILMTAQDIRCGKSLVQLTSLERTSLEEPWGHGGAHHLPLKAEEYTDFILAWYRNFGEPTPKMVLDMQTGWSVADDGLIALNYELEQIVAQIESNQILSVKRLGPGSVDDVNRICHGAHARLLGESAGERFLAGEPVIIVKNDYTKGVFNGDQGIILMCEWSGIEGLGLVMRTQGGFRALPLGQVSDILQHAYSITVHKSQGSEFERIAVILPDEVSPIMSRELIYTAITRARSAVSIAGPDIVLQSSLANPVARNTSLVDLVVEGA